MFENSFHEQYEFSGQGLNDSEKLLGQPMYYVVSIATVMYLFFFDSQVDESTTRQPGMHTKSSIPAEVFTTDICNNVIRITESITDLLTTFINAAPAKEQTTQNGDVAHNGTENGAATNGHKQQADDEGPPKSAPQRLSTKTSHYSPGRTAVKRGGRIGVTPSYSRR